MRRACRSPGLSAAAELAVEHVEAGGVGPDQTERLDDLPAGLLLLDLLGDEPLEERLRGVVLFLRRELVERVDAGRDQRLLLDGRFEGGERRGVLRRGL